MQKVAVNKAEQADCDMRGQVRSEMERCGLSQAQVAREAGVTGARLSQWLAGKYRGDNAAVEEEMRRWLRSRTERKTEGARLPDAPTWIATATAKRVLAALAYAQMAPDMAVVYGGAGVGKTCTAEHYRETNPNVWIATMDSTTASAATALETIAEAVGVKEPPMGANRILRSVRTRVRDTGGLVIVDEAQHLSCEALEAVRSLHDSTKVGVVMLGNETIYSRLTGGSRQAHFAQLFSRIGRRLRLNTPQKEDVSELLDAWGIKGHARKVCEVISAKPGALRGLTKTLRLATMMADGRDEMDPLTIKAAWLDLGGEL